MKALVIYDSTGKIWSIVYGEEELPPGVLAMFVDIPDGANLIRIDVSTPSDPQPVFESYNDTDIGNLKKDMQQVKSDIERMPGKNSFPPQRPCCRQLSRRRLSRMARRCHLPAGPARQRRGKSIRLAAGRISICLRKRS